MTERDRAEEASAIAARRLRLALEWREEWRREIAGRSKDQASTPIVDRADFATALARAEFGRRYFDTYRHRQTIENGAVVWASRKPRGKP